MEIVLRLLYENLFVQKIILLHHRDAWWLEFRLMTQLFGSGDFPLGWASSGIIGLLIKGKQKWICHQPRDQLVSGLKSTMLLTST